VARSYRCRCRPARSAIFTGRLRRLMQFVTVPPESRDQPPHVTRGNGREAATGVGSGCPSVPANGDRNWSFDRIESLAASASPPCMSTKAWTRDACQRARFMVLNVPRERTTARGQILYNGSRLIDGRKPGVCVGYRKVR